MGSRSCGGGVSTGIPNAAGANENVARFEALQG
jgi:hypothetical protein